MAQKWAAELTRRTQNMRHDARGHKRLDYLERLAQRLAAEAVLPLVIARKHVAQVAIGMNEREETALPEYFEMDQKRTFRIVQVIEFQLE
jgi:hypothetical protein